MRPREKIDILIVTAADGEDLAVRTVFGDGWERMTPASPVNLYWHKTTLASKKGRRFTVALVRADMGADNAGPITQKMVDHLRPNFIAMCGICAGHPEDTKLGDVIIASKVFRYDRKSVKALPDDSPEEKWDITAFSLAHPWWQLAKLLDEDIPGIRVHSSPMATGETLCRDPAVWEEIGKYERKCIGLEMEASVIGQIGHIEEKRWVVVKGVSDHATSKKNDRYHKLAKENAAKVLKEFLENVADQLPSIDVVDGIWVPPVVLGGKPMNPMNNAPSTLLHAKNESVPFSDMIRQPEFEALQALCRSDYTSRGIIQLFTGPGGTGKTRLMIEWVRRLKEMDTAWETCFLTQGIDPNSRDFKDIFSQDSHLFFVIDYAECRTNLSSILRILVAAATEKPDRMIRAALLARHKDVWWKELSSNNLDISGYLHGHVVGLCNIPIQGDMRRHLFDSACQAFAEKLSDSSNKEAKNYDMLAAPVFGRVLYIHMAAYATVVGLNFTAENVLDVIVNYEKHFWTVQFREKISGDQAKAKFIRETACVLTALTLFGGVDTNKKLTDLIGIVQGPDEKLFPEFLRNFYPPAYLGKVVGYLEPDLLGEYLVLDTLRSLRKQGVPFTDTAFITSTFNITDDSNELQQAFTVLGRIAEHDICKTDPEKTMVKEWLSLPFDEGHLGVRTLPAVGAAISLAEKTAFCPIPDILANKLEKDGSVLLASEIKEKLPDDSVAFRGLQLWVTGTILNHFIHKKDITEKYQQDYAEALLNHSKALLDLGQRNDAVEATQKAVEIYRALVISCSNTFLPGLAKSLHSLGMRFAKIGRHNEALEAASEAVNRYRSLSTTNPTVFLPNLARSLNSLGNRFYELDRRDEALEVAREVVNIFRTLVEDHPDVFCSNLAGSLSNLGVQLSELNRQEEALELTMEAVAKYRLLATSHPDAYLPYLALSLNNSSVQFNMCGQGKEALEASREATKLYRLLAEAYPDAFLPNLAKSLNSLANRLGKLAQSEEALKIAREAVEIRYRLVTFHSDVFLPDLAESFITLGNRLNELGRHKEALEVAQKAVDIRRQLSASHPSNSDYNLGLSLNALGYALNELGRSSEALDVIFEAVKIQRHLTTIRSDTSSLSVLAESLNLLGKIFGKLRQHEEALEVTSEATAILCEMVKTYPESYNPDFTRSLINLGDRFHALNQYENALVSYNEATSIIRTMAEKYPQVFEEDIYRNLYGRIRALQLLGKEDEIPPEEMVEFNKLAKIYRSED